MSVTTILLSVLILSIILLRDYLKMLCECRRKVKLTSIRYVKGSTGEKEQQISEAEYEQAPGPKPWPLIGNLFTIGQYDVPFIAFTELSKKYGDIYSLTLGSTRCLVVNNIELIREVLNQNGKFFGGRPDFLRFHTLFGGDRSNSLALCDWSHLQQKRRNLARKHCSPRETSSYYSKMSEVGTMEMAEFMKKIASINNGNDFHLKPYIQQTCANMFAHYMCSTRFDYEDDDFRAIVRCFDDIFWEINQGYAVDFLPWLAPFYGKHLGKIVTWSTEIRRFILDRIVKDREMNLDPDEPVKDFTDALLKSLIEDSTVTRDTIIYMLEDFLGGHSAIGNLVILSLGYIVKNPEVGVRIQEELDRVTNNGSRKVTLYDTEILPYTVATIYEVLRYSSSPIVPHVATEDASISGFGVTKGTMIFINNYKLNKGGQYWDEPGRFDPARFLETVTNETSSCPERNISESSDSGIDDSSQRRNDKSITDDYKKCQTNRIRKNMPHFLPFSIGKRTCIGQNLVRGFSFIMLANIMQTYDVTCSQPELIQINPACVAVPADTFPLTLKLRKISTN